MRKGHLVAAILILVTLLAASNAYASSLTSLPNSKVFVAADLTLASPASSNFASEFFVVLQAAAPVTVAGPPNQLMGRLFIFNPVSSCGIGVPAVVPVSGGLFTNPTTGAQTLNFTGYAPPDPCIRLGAALVTIIIGPLRYAPPDPCVLTLHVPGITITFTGETARFILITTTTTSSTSTPPT